VLPARPSWPLPVAVPLPPPVPQLLLHPLGLPPLLPLARPALAPELLLLPQLLPLPLEPPMLALVALPLLTPVALPALVPKLLLAPQVLLLPLEPPLLAPVPLPPLAAAPVPAGPGGVPGLRFTSAAATVAAAAWRDMCSAISFAAFRSKEPVDACKGAGVGLVGVWEGRGEQVLEGGQEGRIGVGRREGGEACTFKGRAAAPQEQVSGHSLAARPSLISQLRARFWRRPHGATHGVAPLAQGGRDTDIARVLPLRGLPSPRLRRRYTPSCTSPPSFTPPTPSSRRRRCIALRRCPSQCSPRRPTSCPGAGAPSSRRRQGLPLK